MAEREQALINVLERLADEMTQQENKLASLVTLQKELNKNMEVSAQQFRARHTNTGKSYDTLSDTVTHYRSDMLSIVSEQDRINLNIEELSRQLKAAIYTSDVTSKKLVEIEERLSRLEKTSKEHYEFASKQPQLYRDAISDSSRDFSKLHASTEKHISELQKQIENLLNSFQHETLRRLLLLDGIVTSLQVLLTRTEPPEKKPLWIKRIFIRIRGFFRRLFPFSTKNK